MASYDLIFQGQIIDSESLDSSSLQQRKNNIARLFNADAEKADILFSGKPFVIKTNIDETAAKKYLSVLKKAGALVHAEKIQVLEEKKYPADNSSEDHFPDNNQTVSSSPVSSTSPGASSPVNSSSGASSSGGLSAGLSALLNYNQHVQQASPEPEAASGSTSDSPETILELHLAPQGTDFSDLKKNIEAAKIADLSHISVSGPQTGSLQEFAEKAAPVEIPDISSLSMSEAQQGTLAGIEHKPEPVVLPDISHLKYSS